MKPTEGLLPSFTVEDIRQYVYCPRIVYFRYVLRSVARSTIKMRRGADRHEAWRRKQIRRGDRTDRFFGLYFANDSLGLRGLLDAVDLRDGNVARPVEIKTGRHAPGQVSPHHRVQVYAECFLLESCTCFEVDGGLIIYIDADKEYFVPFGDRERILTHDILTEMQSVVLEEVLPPPAPQDNKCTDCEYWPWCLRT